MLMPHHLHETEQFKQTDATEPLLDDNEALPLRDFNSDQIYADNRPSKANRNFLNNLVLWASGPRRRRQFRVTSLFPNIQKGLLELFDKYAPTPFFKVVVLALICLLWLIGFGSLAAKSVSLADVPGFGSPRRLSCISTPWPNNGDSCGLDGVDCLPFENASFAFRCPPDCARVHVAEERWVGSQSAHYRHLVIGGPNNASRFGDNTTFYRGDSLICTAAIHAGVLENSRGGCGILTFLGERPSYSSTEQNGIVSIEFDSSFPMSFAVKSIERQNDACADLKWIALLVSALFTIIISLFTTSPGVFYFNIFTVVFFQVALLSDAPDFEDYLSVVQVSLSRFLPAMFIALVIFILCVQKTLNGLDAQVEKTILWLGGCWFGALENYTLDRLPLSRLTPRDFSQSGSVAVLIFLVVIIVLAATVQAWALWSEGRMPRYIALYAILTCSLGVLSQVPELHLRVHHYILALLLLPGTAVQTRLSLLFQGFLVGLFINGVARWGFASILETNASLSRLGPSGTAVPAISPPIIEGGKITFKSPVVGEDWDGISVRVNDVERSRWFKTGEEFALSWTRTRDEPLYFQFGYFRMGFIEGIFQGDYTKVGTWARNASWILPSD